MLIEKQQNMRIKPAANNWNNVCNSQKTKYFLRLTIELTVKKMCLFSYDRTSLDLADNLFNDNLKNGLTIQRFN